MGASGVGPGAGRITANTYSGIPIALIRWDGTSNNPSLGWYTSAGFGNYFPSNANFNYRKPTARVFASELGTTPQWDNGAIFGSGVDTQNIVDHELAYATRKIDGWIFDLYPPASMLNPGDETQVSDIMLAWDAYFASPIKNACGVKFAPLLQWSWYDYKSGIYRTAWNNYLATFLSDPLWLKMFSRKVVVLYNDGGAAGWQGNLAAFNTMCTALGGRGALYVIGVTTTALCTALSLDAKMTYGPNGALPAGSGEGSAALQVTTDAATWGALPGEQKIGNFTPGQDRRTFSAGTRYTDMFTRPALVTHLTNAISLTGSPAGAIGYSHSEICEGNDPYDQGTYDCAGFVRGGYKPQRYTYETDCHSASIAGETNAVILTGAGWSYQLGVQGAYHNDEMWTSTATDSIKLNAHDALQSVSLFGSTLLIGGTATVFIDGVSSGTISFNGPTAVHQTLWTHDFSDNPPVAHTVEVIADGTGQIRVDSFGITYKPP